MIETKRELLSAPGGETSFRTTLQTSSGYILQVLDYGATVASLLVPDRAGQIDDVVLGYDDLAGYLEGRVFMGATVGRVANRIFEGEFALAGQNYALEVNDAPHHLHGGPRGWYRANWESRTEVVAGRGRIVLDHTSPDGDAGYPGTVRARVIYTLSEAGEFRVDMLATTNALTVLNMAHHSYWNLAGPSAPNIFDHELTLFSDRRTPGVSDLASGVTKAVEGTGFDLRMATQLGAACAALKQEDSARLGFDHNFVVRGQQNELRPVARLRDPLSSRVMSLSANQPGVQFYSGQHLSATTRGKGALHAPHAGLCLETQAYPNAVNVPAWRDQVTLSPGQRYHHVMVHQFSLE